MQRILPSGSPGTRRRPPSATRVAAVLLLVVPGLLGACENIQETNGWTPSGAAWENQVAPDVAARKSDPPDQLYRKAQMLFAAQQWEAAGEAFGWVWKEHPTSSWAPDARFYEAECRYCMQKWNAAFEFYKGYMRAQPLSPHAATVQKRLFDMGKWVIQEGANGVLGIFEYSREGVDILQYLVQTFPNGDLADDALLEMARFEAEHRRPQDAVIHLQDLIERYPSSEWAREARLRIARAYRDMNRGSSYDADALKRAAAHYRTWIADVNATPELASEYAERTAEARAELAEVEETLAEKEYRSAEFYLGQGRNDAARTVLESLVRSYPETSAAARARETLGTSGGNQ